MTTSGTGTTSTGARRLIRPFARFAARVTMRAALWQYRAAVTACDFAGAWLPMRWHARVCPFHRGTRTWLDGDDLRT